MELGDGFFEIAERVLMASALMTISMRAGDGVRVSPSRALSREYFLIVQ
jgi:hypothetical protein